MNKKVLLLGGGVLIALLLVALAGAAIVSAQGATPTPTPQPGAARPGKGFGGPGLWGLCGGPDGRWTVFDAVAAALGLKPEALFSELHAGKTLEEIAEAQGVDIQKVYDAIRAARSEALKQAIEQAVAEGKMTREQADWLLEGIEKGYMPMGRGLGPLGRGPHFGGRGRWGDCPGSE
ncbi:MAG: hypothetical protein N2508_15030 [Anaerolineae bacterium]|nr:hypothetical protein [Anaerolineae bacterium]